MADSLKNRCTRPSLPLCPKYSTLNTSKPPPYPSCQTKHQTASNEGDFEDQCWEELKLIVTTIRLRRRWQQNADIMIVKMIKKMRVVALSPAYHPPPLPRRNITPFCQINTWTNWISSPLIVFLALLSLCSPQMLFLKLTLLQIGLDFAVDCSTRLIVCSHQTRARL